MFEDAANPRNGIVWGTLRNQATAAALASAVADFPGAPTFMRDRYGCLAASQLNYILGDTGRSFIVGEGRNPPKQAHSREAFCQQEDNIRDCSPERFSSANLDNPNVRLLAGLAFCCPGLLRPTFATAASNAPVPTSTTRTCTPLPFLLAICEYCRERFSSANVY